MYREAPDVRSRAGGGTRERVSSRPVPSLQGELRHVYLLPDAAGPAATGGPIDPGDTSWETAFAHVRRLVRDHKA